MKFSEKLSKLRKEAKMSQQELAEYLDISRQAVSKWESGISYPEMDKLLVLCKLFKCSLDDLTNDEVSELKVETANKHNNVFIDFLDLIVKTFDMFRCMKFKQIIECIFSMGILVFCLLMLLIPGYVIFVLGAQLAYKLSPYTNFLEQLWAFICIFIYTIFFIMTVCYVFKKRYLDNFKEVDKIVITNNDKEIVYEKSDKVLTFVPNEHDNSFFKLLTKIFMFCIKGMYILFLIPFIISFICLFSLFVIDILLLFKGVIYIGVTIGIIFCILLNYVILEFSYDFLFNKKVAFKRIFIMIITSLAGLGISLGIFAIEVSNTKYISDSLINNNTETIKTLKFNKDMYFANYYNHYYDINYYDNIEFVTDDTLNDTVIIEANYNKDFRKMDVYNEENGIYVYPFENNDLNSNKLVLDMLIKDLSKKQVHNYSTLYDYKIMIKSSSKNINIIKNNTDKKIKEEEKKYNNNQINQYKKTISEYQTKIEKLEDKISELEEKNNDLNSTNEELQEEIENLKSKIEEYKNNINSILDEE